MAATTTGSPRRRPCDRRQPRSDPRRGRGLSSLPSVGRMAGEGRAREGRAFRGPGVLGEAGPGLGRSGGGRPDPRTGPSRSWWEPDRPHLHRRPERRLPVRLAAPHRVREPTDVGLGGRRPAGRRRLHRRGQPVRAAGQQADARRTGPMPPVPGAGDQRVDPPEGDRRAGRAGLGRGAPRHERARSHGEAASSVRPPRRGSGSDRSSSSAATTRASRTRSPASSRRRCWTRCSSGPAS